MANKAVMLMWRCKTEAGWKRFPVLIASNGRVRTGVVMVDGRERRYPEGRFILRSFAGAQTVFTSLPENATGTEALAERDKLALRLEARTAAHNAGAQIVEEPGRTALRTAAKKYIQRAKDKGAAEAAITYAKALEHFLTAMDADGVRFADEVGEPEILRFQAWLRDKLKNEPRTVYNKVSAVRGLLMWLGTDKKKLGRKPVVEKTVPRVYTRDEVSSLLGAATEYMHVAISVLYQAGIREQEAAFLAWEDLDLREGTLRVRSKPQDGFTIKDREERDVPIPPELVAILKGWQTKRKGTKWVLGSQNDKPQTKLLLHLKWTAKNAGLNCGKCDGCKDRQECEQYTLHSFRRSYATRLSQSGWDARSIMAVMGHSDIATTMRYLAPMETGERRKMLTGVKW